MSIKNSWTSKSKLSPRSGFAALRHLSVKRDHKIFLKLCTRSKSTIEMPEQ